MSIIPTTNPMEENSSLALPQLSQEDPLFVSKDVDWKETIEAHVFRADMTSLNKEEVKVDVEEGGVLQISAERSVQREENNGDAMHRVKCATGRFSRSFTLPANARMDQLKPSIDNGVLTVTVPKDDLNLLHAVSN
ncbi:18.1 kDa class I heat shock protein-like [Arachis duranensis]|uniref:18.1 kDa class I heat shock protein-like n=1 Tax=Arachis duranensis TaxID=130453 RepID=A0A6P4CRS1_ARADU|nr:18.1 kDa class I heat shock protein-like [Arachis duranensis]